MTIAQAVLAKSNAKKGWGKPAPFVKFNSTPNLGDTMSKTIYNQSKVDFGAQPLFFGAEPNIARNDMMKYPQLERMDKKMQSFFWQPEEIALLKDRNDYLNMGAGARHMFLENLRFQTLLDSVQERGPTLAFLPVCSLPELEQCLITWGFFEKIHSQSYQYIIKNVFPDPTPVFDVITEHAQIASRAATVTAAYDDYINAYYRHVGARQLGISQDDERFSIPSEYELKKKLYKALMSVNVLEGIRFYVSFACNFALAENKLMVGSASILKLICRDENLHLGLTQTLIRSMINGNEGEEWFTIANECADESLEMFEVAVSQEKEWAKYLFSEGDILGLNANILGQYVDHISNKRLTSIKLPNIFKKTENPLPWMDKWISSKDVQVAPQETEIVAYVSSSGINSDVRPDDFKGII